MAPVKDTHVLNLIWCLPPLQHKYKSKPDDYVAHLIGHEVRVGQASHHRRGLLGCAMWLQA